MEQHFQMFAYYNRWANELLYSAAADLSDADYRLDLGLFFGSVHRTFNHLLVTDRIWMKRFTGEGDHPNQLDAIITDDFIKLRDMRRAEDDAAGLPDTNTEMSYGIAAEPARISTSAAMFR